MDKPSVVRTLCDLYLNMPAAKKSYGILQTEAVLNLLSVICSDKPGTEFSIKVDSNNFDGQTPRFFSLLEDAGLAYLATLTYENHGPDGREIQTQHVSDDGTSHTTTARDHSTRHWLHIATGTPEAVRTLHEHGGWEQAENYHPTAVADFLGIPESQRSEKLHFTAYQEGVRERLDTGYLSDAEAAYLTMFLNYAPQPTDAGVDAAIAHANTRNKDIRAFAATHDISEVVEVLDEIVDSRIDELDDWW